jgi:hypothetical protein
VIRRFFAFPLVRLVLIVLLFGALSTPFVLAAHGRHSTWTDVTLSWVLLAALLLSTVVVERVTVRKSLAAIGFGPRYAVRDFVVGAAATWISTMAIALEAGLLVAAVRRSQVVPAAWKMSRTPQ